MFPSVRPGFSEGEARFRRGAGRVNRQVLLMLVLGRLEQRARIAKVGSRFRKTLRPAQKKPNKTAEPFVLVDSRVMGRLHA